MLRKLLGLIALLVLVFIVLVVTGVVSLKTEGEFRAPNLNLTAEGGEIPKVDVDAKELVIGTTEKEVEVPAVGTSRQTIDVPNIEVRDGNSTKN